MEGICDLFYASSWPRFIISIDDKRNKYNLKTSFAIYALLLFTIQKNILSISMNGEKSIKIICILINNYV